MVTIKDRDGNIYTNPADVHIPCDEEHKAFYDMLLQQELKKEKKSEERTV